MKKRLRQVMRERGKKNQGRKDAKKVRYILTEEEGERIKESELKRTSKQRWMKEKRERMKLEY